MCINKKIAFIWGIVICTMCFGLYDAFAANPDADFTYQSLTNLGPCASSRVLLCNVDKNSICPIEGQGYYDTNETTTAVNGTFWWHDSAAKPTGTANTQLNLLPGINHVLYQKTDNVGGKKALWTLVECRTGSGGYRATSGTTNGRRNYLPWSETCQPIDTNNFTAPIPVTWKSGAANLGGIKQVAHISMRATEAATVYSPYYEDGIGEIYFDVVNGFSLNNPDSIEVQIATTLAEKEDEGSGDVSSMEDGLDLELDYAENRRFEV